MSIPQECHSTGCYVAFKLEICSWIDFYFPLAHVAWFCLFVLVLHWFSVFLIISGLLYSSSCLVLGFWNTQCSNFFCNSSSGQFHFHFLFYFQRKFFPLSGLFISLSAPAFWLLRFLPPVSCSPSPAAPLSFASFRLWSGFLVMGLLGFLF